MGAETGAEMGAVNGTPEIPDPEFGATTGCATPEAGAEMGALTGALGGAPEMPMPDAETGAVTGIPEMPDAEAGAVTGIPEMPDAEAGAVTGIPEMPDAAREAGAPRGTFLTPDPDAVLTMGAGPLGETMPDAALLIGAAEVTAATARRTRTVSCIVTVVLGCGVFLRYRFVVLRILPVEEEEFGSGEMRSLYEARIQAIEQPLVGFGVVLALA